MQANNARQTGMRPRRADGTLVKSVKAVKTGDRIHTMVTNVEFGSVVGK